MSLGQVQPPVLVWSVSPPELHLGDHCVANILLQLSLCSIPYSRAGTWMCKTRYHTDAPATCPQTVLAIVETQNHGVRLLVVGRQVIHLKHFTIQLPTTYTEFHATRLLLGSNAFRNVHGCFAFSAVNETSLCLCI
jgi:hypothetical protein